MALKAGFEDYRKEFPLPYNYIAIEGNIGAGKTSLCLKMAKDYNSRLILEEFSENPFLPYFYENPDRYAFPVELFFMAERHKQLEAELNSPDLFNQNIIADYFFLKTLLFAKNNLSAEEYRLFQRLFQVLNSSFPKPEILVYLHRSVPNLLTNIQKRGRSYEQDISADYLQQIQDAYFEFFKIEDSIPILVIDLGDTDFIQEPKNYHHILSLLQDTYKLGINTISLR